MESANIISDGNIQPDQEDVIIYYMSNHSEFAANRYTGINGKQTKKLQWQRLTDLVSNCGPAKNVKQVQACWSSLKSRAKTYNANKKRALTETGNKENGKLFTYNPRMENVLNVVGTSHGNGLNLVAEAGIANASSTVPKKVTMKNKNRVVYEFPKFHEKPTDLKNIAIKIEPTTNLINQRLNLKNVPNMDTRKLAQMQPKMKMTNVTRSTLKYVPNIDTVKLEQIQPTTKMATVTRSTLKNVSNIGSIKLEQMQPSMKMVNVTRSTLKKANVINVSRNALENISNMNPVNTERVEEQTKEAYKKNYNDYLGSWRKKSNTPTKTIQTVKAVEENTNTVKELILQLKAMQDLSEKRYCLMQDHYKQKEDYLKKKLELLSRGNE